ncbi:MAG: HEAT repeat domain-containing protein [Chloroflexi bacterium]|nr:HEAT repeat domain-containing protein [Chloroflexota bacterium]
MTEQTGWGSSQTSWVDHVPQLQAGRAADRRSAIRWLYYEANTPEAMAAVLPRLRTMAAQDRSARVRATARDTVAFMEKLAPDPLAYWTAQLQSPRWDERSTAIDRLGQIGDSSTVDLIQQAAASDRSSWVRMSAGRVLRQWGVDPAPETTPTWYQGILKRLADPTQATPIKGFLVHRQNKQPLHRDEIALLTAAFQEVESLDENMAHLARAAGLQFVYTAHKQPFGHHGPKTDGLYRSDWHLIFIGLGATGQQVPALAHELFGHWLLDQHQEQRRGRVLPYTLEDPVRHYEQSMQCQADLSYNARLPDEIWSRMVEQCLCLLLNSKPASGDYADLPVMADPRCYDRPGYWPRSEWPSLLRDVRAILRQQIQDAGRQHHVAVTKRGLLWQE